MRSCTIAVLCVASFCSLCPPAFAAKQRPAAQPAPAALTAQSVNDSVAGAKAGKGADAAIVKAGVLLDRAGFSPGVVDGRDGENFKKALVAFQKENGLQTTGRLDQQTWSALAEGSDQPVLVEYEIAPADVKGPFLRKLPRRMEDMAHLPRLSYTSAREGLAEKFHMSEDLLRALNPRISFDQAGARIAVANVKRVGRAPGETTSSGGGAQKENTKGPAAAKVEVDKKERALRVFGEDGKLIAYFPATIGSAEKPGPSGSFKVNQIAYDPTYRYDPKYAFKEIKVQRKFTIRPGPNNPVGLVWIDLTAQSYGIHGTPNPEQISKTQSHGCVRLTNWDALALAAMVRKGTPVDFVD